VRTSVRTDALSVPVVSQAPLFGDLNAGDGVIEEHDPIPFVPWPKSVVIVNIIPNITIGSIDTCSKKDM